MCGIYGIIKTKGPALSDEQRDQWARLTGALAVLSTARGADSTGVMDVASDGTIDVLKDAVPAWELLTANRWRGVVTPDNETVATIGHTRYATHGAVTAGNAHPFVFSAESGDVTAAVHNGVINNHATLRVGDKVYAVDSANLIAALASEEPRKWKDILRGAQGTLALAIARVTDGKPTVYLTRRGNPTWMVKVAELNAMAFASTKEILESAIKHSRLTKVGAARETEEGRFYTFEGNAMVEGARWAQPVAVVKVVKSKKIGKKHARISWTDEHVGPGRTVGSNGKEYARCGSCLDWENPADMHIDGDRQLCTRCKIAADAWPKGAKKAWDNSRWGDGTKVAAAVKRSKKGVK